MRPAGPGSLVKLRRLELLDSESTSPIPAEPGPLGSLQRPFLSISQLTVVVPTARATLPAFDAQSGGG